jgi:hypothetical protein
VEQRWRVTLKVGDVADDDGYFTGVDLKATDLLAGESLSFALAGGKAGAYIANSQVSPRYSASARVVSGIITTASTGGSRRPYPDDGDLQPAGRG